MSDLTVERIVIKPESYRPVTVYVSGDTLSEIRFVRIGETDRLTANSLKIGESFSKVLIPVDQFDGTAVDFARTVVNEQTEYTVDDGGGEGR